VQEQTIFEGQMDIYARNAEQQAVVCQQTASPYPTLHGQFFSRAGTSASDELFLSSRPGRNTVY
jgi:hypothetical protein